MTIDWLKLKKHHERSLGQVIIFACLLSMLLSQIGYASSFHLRLQPLPPIDETALAAEKFGSIPDFSDEAWRAFLDGAIRTRVLKNTSEAHSYECTAVIDAPRERVMALLKDYPLRRQINSNLESIVVEWEGNVAWVHQTFRYGLKKVSVDLKFLHLQDKYVEWELVDGDFRELSGNYKLFSIENGTRTLLIQRTNIDPAMSVPSFILNHATQKSMRTEIEAVRDLIADW